ncbi:MAG: hypothetical protein QNJ05_08635 [Woeseiaceae bacterium]|nr:hypothetical protein [Woeseiaceae bacterium]
MGTKPAWLATLSILVLGLVSDPADALTTEGFMEICAQAERKCEEIPILKAYVGGALDLVATLHEATDYVEDIYCKDPELLFDVAAIIRFIEENQAGYEDENAMLLVVRFLETYGGC